MGGHWVVAIVRDVYGYRIEIDEERTIETKKKRTKTENECHCAAPKTMNNNSPLINKTLKASFVHPKPKL